MKSIRLDQLDSYQKSFKSSAVAIDQQEDVSWVALAESLFYPTSGGQPFDIGELNKVAVLEVEKRGDCVWHKLERPSINQGDIVEGMIDWPRRFKHMQRHTGQHLLSQAFLRINPKFETKSVSLRSETCTIDFAGEPQNTDLEAAELLVNEVAYKNIPITAFEVNESEIAKYPLRRPPKVSGSIRLVKMGDWELSACGGTHLRSSAEAAPLKLLRSERIKSGLVRVYFKVGLEALADYQEKHLIAYDLAQSFSSQVSQLPERIDSLKADLKEAKLTAINAQKDLANYLAKDLLSKASPCGKGSLIVHSLDEHEQALLNPLAERLLVHKDIIVLLAVRLTEGVKLLFTRSTNVNCDMNALLKQILPLIDGRGGGKPDRAQGVGSKPQMLDQALEVARAFITDRQ